MKNLRSRDVLRWLTIMWMACAGWATAQSEPASWVIQATYFLPGGADGGSTVRWLFSVQEEIPRADGLWWRVVVRDADGLSPVEATFLLNPRHGLIAAVQVREFFQAAWHEYPIQQEEPSSGYFQAFSPLPLDFVGRDGLRTDRIQNFRVSTVQAMEGQHKVRREYGIRTEPVPDLPEVLREAGLGKAACGPCLTLQIEDSFPSGLRWMTWDARLPWWVEYRCPAYTARLVEWKGGTGR